MPAPKESPKTVFMLKFVRQSKEITAQIEAMAIGAEGEQKFFGSTDFVAKEEFFNTAPCYNACEEVLSEAIQQRHFTSRARHELRRASASYFVVGKSQTLLPVGFAFVIEIESEWRVCYVMTFHTYRRQGFCKAMMLRLEQEAAKRGIERLQLQCISDRVETYKNAGFQVVLPHVHQ